VDPVDPDPDSDPEHCLLVTTMSPPPPLLQLELATCPTGNTPMLPGCNWWDG
jgi:hypothetical protein